MAYKKSGQKVAVGERSEAKGMEHHFIVRAFEKPLSVRERLKALKAMREALEDAGLEVGYYRKAGSMPRVKAPKSTKPAKAEKKGARRAKRTEAAHAATIPAPIEQIEAPIATSAASAADVVQAAVAASSVPPPAEAHTAPVVDEAHAEPTVSEVVITPEAGHGAADAFPGTDFPVAIAPDLSCANSVGADI